LYRDPQGRTWFLLNEVLNLPAHQGVTAEGTEAVVALAVETVFGRAAEVLALLTAGVLTPSTIWRLTQGVGKTIPEAEAKAVERVFGQGAAPQPQGEQAAPRLSIEAEGVLVRQRTGQGHTAWREVRVGLAYDDMGLAGQAPGSPPYGALGTPKRLCRRRGGEVRPIWKARCGR